MQKQIYIGKTLAYRRFKQGILKTQSLLELGVAGIDAKVETTYGDLLKKFDHVKGLPGRKPKNYKPQITKKEGQGGTVELQMDNRSAAMH